jgi:YHS domain-containing protein
MDLRHISFCLAAVLVGSLVIAADAEKAKFSAKCLVAGKPDAKEDKFAEYKGGKVYFCCDNCKAKFTGETAKFAAAANHQLVATQQFTQTKCPISGQPVDESKTVEVGGVKVAFCCENCQGKAAAASEADRKEMLFKNAAFDESFAIIKKTK